jgi:tetratricopeptide (TPR) repeat protein
METYRLSSKLRDKDREYLIQTANDSSVGSVATTTYVDGILTEAVNCPHPSDIRPQDVLSLVKLTHEEKKKEIEQLLQTYRRVIDGGDPELMYQLGTAFYYKGFLMESKELCRSALQMNSEHHQSYNQLGVTELGLGSTAAAIAAGLEAVNRRPRFADYHNNLGESYLADSDFRAAIVQFEEAIGINLYYADAYFNLGLTHLAALASRPTDPGTNERMAAKIVDCFHKGSLIHPAYVTPQFSLGMDAVRGHVFDRALMLFRAVRDAKKESHRQEFAGFYMKFILFPEWVSEKVVQERIAFLQQEIAKNPMYVDLQVDLAHCFLEQARMSWQKGIEYYHQSMEMNPALARIQSSLDHIERAYQKMCAALGKVTEKA